MQYCEFLNLLGHNADDRRKRDWRLRYGKSHDLGATSQAGHDGVQQPPGHEERIAVMQERAEREVPLDFGKETGDSAEMSAY